MVVGQPCRRTERGRRAPTLMDTLIRDLCTRSTPPLLHEPLANTAALFFRYLNAASLGLVRVFGGLLLVVVALALVGGLLLVVVALALVGGLLLVVVALALVGGLLLVVIALALVGGLLLVVVVLALVGGLLLVVVALRLGRRLRTGPCLVAASTPWSAGPPAADLCWRRLPRPCGVRTSVRCDWARTAASGRLRLVRAPRFLSREPFLPRRGPCSFRYLALVRFRASLRRRVPSLQRR